jgi:hypothetical protein
MFGREKLAKHLQTHRNELVRGYDKQTDVTLLA